MACTPDNKYPAKPCPCPEIPGPKGDTGPVGIQGPQGEQGDPASTIYGHAYSTATQNITSGSSITWTTLQLNSGVTKPNPTELTVSESGIYQITFVLNLYLIPS